MGHIKDEFVCNLVVWVVRVGPRIVPVESALIGVPQKIFARALSPGQLPSQSCARLRFQSRFLVANEMIFAKLVHEHHGYKPEILNPHIRKKLQKLCHFNRIVDLTFDQIASDVQLILPHKFANILYRCMPFIGAENRAVSFLVVMMHAQGNVIDLIQKSLFVKIL